MLSSQNKNEIPGTAVTAATADMVRALNWSGSIPIVLSLAPSSLSSPTMPNPIHVMVPRQSYLFVALKDAVHRLHKFAPEVLMLSIHRNSNHSLVRNEPNEGEDTNLSPQIPISEMEPESATDTTDTSSTPTTPAKKKPPMDTAYTSYPTCWFEDLDTKIPLRWQLSAGVLWDLKPHPKTLPWNIRLHFTQNTSTTSSSPLELLLLPLETDPWTAVQRYFKNSLKQALFLQNGSSKVAMNLSKQSHQHIWHAVVTVNYKLYQQVNHAELQQPFQQEANLQYAAVKLLPIRLLIDSNPPIQKSVQYCNTTTSPSTDDSIVTLGDLLTAWAPSLFQKSSQRQDNPDDLGTTTTITIPTDHDAQWTIQGLRNISLSANLMELWYSLCHPDHFLYIIVTSKASSHY